MKAKSKARYHWKSKFHTFFIYLGSFGGVQMEINFGLNIKVIKAKKAAMIGQNCKSQSGKFIGPNLVLLHYYFFLFCNRGSSTWLWSDHCVLVRPMQSLDGLRTRELGQSPISSASRYVWRRFSGPKTHGTHHRTILSMDVGVARIHNWNVHPVDISSAEVMCDV